MTNKIIKRFKLIINYINMSEQNIIDALNNLASETEKLRIEVRDLTEINKQLKTQVYELKEKVSNLE